MMYKNEIVGQVVDEPSLKPGADLRGATGAIAPPESKKLHVLYSISYMCYFVHSFYLYS